MFQFIKKLYKKDLNLCLWFFLPIIILFIILFTKIAFTEIFNKFFPSEGGIIENGTFVILFFSIIISFLTLKIIKIKIKQKKLLIIIFFYTLGLIYFAGEEISWGQHWFHWEATEFFKTYNDQYIGNTSETNFHNISSWFDQKPRILLTFFVLIGGIICPIFLSNNININSLKFWIYPTYHSFPTSLICLFFFLLDNSYKILCFGEPGIDNYCKYLPYFLYFRTSEIIELYIALFLLIYISSINFRLKKI